MEVFVLLFLFILLVVIVIGSSGTSLGRLMLPRVVTDAVSKLLPETLITDATANVEGDTEVIVGGSANPKTVHVRRGTDSTVAWTHDDAAAFPRSGTFVLTSFRHNLKPDSIVSPEKLRARIENSLIDALAPKRFQPAEPDVATLGIHVFAAFEHEVTLEELGEAFDDRDGHAWGTALRTALKQDRVDKTATFARGSLLFEVVDSRSNRSLWQAVAMADVVIDVREEERDRRVRAAIVELFKKFPPH